MNEDHLKRHTVQVGAGSGCLFQSLLDKDTYVLTSRHLFCDQQEENGITNFRERNDGQKVTIKYYEQGNGQWKTNELELTLTQGWNYFSHLRSGVDAAILKIPRIGKYDQIVIDDSDSTSADFRICGHPTNRRNQSDSYTSYIIHGNIASTNFEQTAQLALGNLTQDHIEGMSGGGILKIEDSTILIAGIQSRMLSALLPAGQIAFVPMKYYKEIVASNPSHLKELLSRATPPPNLSTRNGDFDNLKQVVFGHQRFSVFCMAFFLCVFLAATVFCILGPDSQTVLAGAAAAIALLLAIIAGIRFRGYKSKMVIHDVYVNRYLLAPPPPHFEIEDKIIANAKI